MNRTTIDFGIDLGTTNSAVAVFTGNHGEPTKVVKNTTDGNDADITPSAVYINKKGALRVGRRAKDRIVDEDEDVYIEFKRQMGTDYAYRFKSSGQNRSPEELSAEVLKSLRADVQQRTAEVVEASVITVPAAFELHQCDATRLKAGNLGPGAVTVTCARCRKTLAFCAMRRVIMSIMPPHPHPRLGTDKARSEAGRGHDGFRVSA